VTEKQTAVLAILRSKYAGFDGFANGERVLLAVAHLADVVKVAERTGNNDGEWVEELLKSSGLGKGYPWCAATINWACEMLGVPNPERGDAAVITWRNWARENNRIRVVGKRGDLCFYVRPNGTGHIGIVRDVGDTMVESIEGNTSPGATGSQRDGQGLYRRKRSVNFWQGYIEL
jgi:hypothetical protein